MAACARGFTCRANLGWRIALSPVPILLNEASACLACAAGRPNYAFTKDGYDLFRCGDCGFLFVQPYPAEADIRRYYEGRYRQAGPQHYPKARSRRRRAFWRSLRYLRYVRNKNVLEIGCGGGFMVHAFSQHGARAVGIDFSLNSIDYTRNEFPDCTFYCESPAEFERERLILFSYPRFLSISPGPKR